MKTSTSSSCDPHGNGAVTVCSADGSVRFSLQRTPGGLFVQRTLQGGGKAKVLQSTRFLSAGEFRRWCEADAIRFDHPLMSSRLVRHADELFTQDCSATDAG